MKSYLIRFCIVVTMLVFGIVIGTFGQENIGIWIYIVEQDDLENRVIRLKGDEIQVVLTIPVQSNESLVDMAQPSEIEALSKFYAEGPFGRIPPFTPEQIEEFVNHPNSTKRIVGIEVAPDNEMLALSVRHSKCSSPQYYRCFGVNQVVIWENNTQRIVFENGINSREFFPEWLAVSELDVRIGKMRWITNQMGLLIELDEMRSRGPLNYQLIAVPLSGNILPFEFGSGYIWTIYPDGTGVAAIDDYRALTNDLKFYHFDLDTGQHREERISLGTYFPHFDFGIVYYENYLIFHINHDVAIFESGGGMVVYEPGSGLPLSLIQLNQGVREIQSTPTASRTILQDYDGLLWEVEIVRGELVLEVLVRTPVDFWLLGSNGDLLIQPCGDEGLQWCGKERIRSK